MNIVQRLFRWKWVVDLFLSVSFCPQHLTVSTRTEVPPSVGSLPLCPVSLLSACGAKTRLQCRETPLLRRVSFSTNTSQLISLFSDSPPLEANVHWNPLWTPSYKLRTSSVTMTIMLIATMVIASSSQSFSDLVLKEHCPYHHHDLFCFGLLNWIWFLCVLILCPINSVHPLMSGGCLYLWHFTQCLSNTVMVHVNSCF